MLNVAWRAGSCRAATFQAAPTAALSGDDVYGISCPAFKCTHVLGYWDIQRCVSAELLNEFDTFILNKALDHIPNMTYAHGPTTSRDGCKMIQWC